MKKTFHLSKDFKIDVRSWDAEFNKSARMEVLLDYSELAEHPNVDEDDLERQAQHIATRISQYIGKVCEVTKPEKRQYEGEILLQVKLRDDHTLDEAMQRLESVARVVHDEMKRGRKEYKDTRQKKQLDAITSALGEFKGKTVDQDTIGPIAKSVLSTLGNNGRGK